jgi:hypothetical protein
MKGLAMTVQNEFDSRIKSADKDTKARFAEQSKEGVVNPIVLARIMGVRPQYIYNMIRKGKLVTVDPNNTQKKVIALEVAQAFASEYFGRKAEKAEKRAEAARELQEAAAE